MKRSAGALSRAFAAAAALTLAAPALGQAAPAEPVAFDDMFAASSPDGRRIAFTSTRTGDPEIFVADADGSNLEQLTRSPGRDAHPSWSRDGKRILFQSPREGGHVRLFEMNADGSGVRRLTDNRGFCGVPTLSPDGRAVAYQCSDGPERFGTPEAPWRVFLLDLASLKPRLLTSGPGNDQVPNWSPDGARLLFFSDRGGSDQTYELTLATGAIRQLTTGPDIHRVASYSPDGRRIVLTRGTPDGRFEIQVSNPRGDFVRVADTSQFGSGTFSADGRQVYFYRQTEAGNRLFVVPSDGSAPPRMIEFREAGPPPAPADR